MIIIRGKDKSTVAFVLKTLKLAGQSHIGNVKEANWVSVEKYATDVEEHEFEEAGNRVQSLLVTVVAVAQGIREPVLQIILPADQKPEIEYKWE